MIQTLLIILSLVGFAIAGYFTGIYYGLMKSDVWWIPAFCRMNQQTCSTIIQTPEARVFGIPNFVLGMGFYILIFIGAVSGSLSTIDFLFDLVLAIALFTVILAVYLAYALLMKLRTHCVLCYIAHSINAIIAFLLLHMKYNIV